VIKIEQDKTKIELEAKADLIYLAQLRKKEARYKDKHSQWMDAIKAKNKAFFADYEKVKEEITVTQDALRSRAIELYNLTKEKKFIGGLGVQVRKTLDYSPAVALEWAKKSGLCLALDKESFEKIAKAEALVHDGRQFVQHGEKIIGTIPSKIKLGDD
jgi:hypothetical protein